MQKRNGDEGKRGIINVGVDEGGRGGGHSKRGIDCERSLKQAKQQLETDFEPRG